jgi:hypothetical protein
MTEITGPSDTLIRVIRSITKDVDTAIALNALMASTHYSEELRSAFDNTYEHHAYALMQSSIAYSLCSALMRVFDPNPKARATSSFAWVFEHEAALRSREGVEQVIRALRRQHVYGPQLEQEVKERADQFAAAKKEYEKLKGSHQLQRVKLLRDTVIGHSAQSTPGRTGLFPPKYGDMTYLVKAAQSVIDEISAPLTGEAFDFATTATAFQKISGSFATALTLGMRCTREAGNSLRHL